MQQLQFKIHLLGITKPPVWRRLVVPVSKTFSEFAHAIFSAFGWDGWHLYMFCDKTHRQINIMPRDPDGMLDTWGPAEVFDADELTIGDYYGQYGGQLYFIYDFGDGWEHKLTLEAVLDEPGERARCTGAKGACPPEDCGGPWAYERLKYILAHPDEEHEEVQWRCEWLGIERPEEFDPTEITGFVEAAPKKPRTRRKKTEEDSAG